MSVECLLSITQEEMRDGAVFLPAGKMTRMRVTQESDGGRRSAHDSYMSHGETPGVMGGSGVGSGESKPGFRRRESAAGSRRE